MNIIVLATASRHGGALSIYRQFLKYLPNYTKDNKYYLFIDSSMDQPSIEGVEYIFDDNHSWMHRILWDFNGLSKWLKVNHIQADVVVSFQNTISKTKSRQVIYYHNSIPFYPNKWNPFKGKERVMFLYKHIYPLFVKLSINDKTDIVVQIPYIKKGFVKCFGINEDRVKVMFPDVEKIDSASVLIYDFKQGFYHFVYPAIPEPYKEHKTLVYSLSLLKQRNRELVNKIKIHLTFAKEDFPNLLRLVEENGLVDNFVFNGRVPYQQILSMYKGSCGLLFPSTIETIGLPLLEAAAFGKPIVASDLQYAHEVLNDYEGVKYIDHKCYKGWSEAIENLCKYEKIYSPIQGKESSWPLFFNLVLNR